VDYRLQYEGVGEADLARSRPDRERRARVLAATYDVEPPERGSVADVKAAEVLSRLRRNEHVGHVHHTVPRFLLQRWSEDERVRVYSRVDGRFTVRKIGDLAIRDFYTFVAKDGSLDSSFESILGMVEAAAAPVLHRLLSPFGFAARLTPEDMFRLAQMVSFQAVRTPRRRREMQVQADWYFKTMAGGRLADAKLEEITAVPHQNDLLKASLPAAEKLFPFILHRPLTLVSLDGPRLIIGDEPLVVHKDDEALHLADCQVPHSGPVKQKQHRKRKSGSRGTRGNRQSSDIVHFAAGPPGGLGVAHELVLPISPRCALWWGPLQDEPFLGPPVEVRLKGTDAESFASLQNKAIARQALDWVVSTPSDKSFQSLAFPEHEPLLRVCDSDSAASRAINEVPAPLRPYRIGKHR
jgi:hypothetical protein